MPSLTIIPCIFKKIIQNFPYKTALCYQMHHNQSVKSNFIDKETTKVQSLRVIYFLFMLLQKEITERLLLHEDAAHCIAFK